MMTNWLNFRAGNEAPPPPPAPTEKTFSQTELNSILAENKRGLQNTIATLQAELDNAKKAGTQTTALQAKVDELSKTLMTKEELAANEQKKIQSDYQAQLEQQSTRAKQFEQKFSGLLIQGELTKAALAADAFAPEQILMLLSNATKVKEETDKQGAGTGKYNVVVEIDGLELSAADAVIKMRENKSFANLFKVKGTAGVGGQTLNLTGGTIGDTEMSGDTATYFKQRQALKKEGKI